MATGVKDVSYVSSFCGYCQFFEHCETEYSDHACWEYVEDDIFAGDVATG
jgi:hypothetical protein